MGPDGTLSLRGAKSKGRSVDKCFHEICDCTCEQQTPDFDRIVEEETRLAYKLRQLCRGSIGWLLADEHFLDPNLAQVNGLYFIWEKNGWCELHELYHMKCLYVGKGKIRARLYDHWKQKGFSCNYESTIYTTYTEMPNRHAKYLEQLTLDLFRIPMNRAESRGTMTLCAHFGQSDVD
jgi:hypothetical protein